MYGIDISEHNGYIDLSQYTDKFVIIRAAWGTNEDKMFQRNVSECQRLGIPFGVYIYSYALSDEDAKAEAYYILNLIKGLDIKVGVWFDMEDADAYKSKNGAIHAGLISSMCRAFCSTVEDAGYYAGIYASQSWFGSLITDCDRYDKWVASWGNNDGDIHVDTSDMGTMLQYTSNNGELDEDLMYVDISTYNMGDKPTPEPTPTPEPVAPTEPTSSEFAVGDIVVPTAGVDYNGTPVMSYHSQYTITELNGNRAVLSVDGVVWAAMNTANIRKVGQSTDPTPSLQVGDSVRIENGATDLNTGTTYADFVYNETYTVIQINGNRVVFGINGAVTGATNIANIIRM